jgi:hypothetical protein
MEIPDLGWLTNVSRMVLENARPRPTKQLEIEWKAWAVEREKLPSKGNGNS